MSGIALTVEGAGAVHNAGNKTKKARLVANKGAKRPELSRGGMLMGDIKKEKKINSKEVKN